MCDSLTLYILGIAHDDLHRLPSSSGLARRYPLISGDDKFMTRWIVSQRWKMSMQISPECTLATTFKADGKFFIQILRWTRNTWRSDFKSLVMERTIWNRYPVQVQHVWTPCMCVAGTRVRRQVAPCVYVVLHCVFWACPLHTG